MILIAWRIQRPGLLPMWIGLPLGAFDDLFSGQPFGCAILLWSLALLALEAIETRFPGAGSGKDWVTASGLLVGLSGVRRLHRGRVDRVVADPACPAAAGAQHIAVPHRRTDGGVLRPYPPDPDQGRRLTQR